MTRTSILSALLAALAFAALPAFAETTLGGGKESQMKGGANKSSGGMEKSGAMSKDSTSSDGSKGNAQSDTGTTLGGNQKDNTGK